MPLLVPLLEPVCPGNAFQRTWNLLPCRLVLQYSTPNGILPMARETVPDVLRPEQKKTPLANAFHADERDVRHCGTRRNRTSSAASGAGAGRVRSSPGGNRGFFRKRPLGDGPRRSPTARRLLPSAGEPVPGNGTIAGGDAACPSRSGDIAARHATATTPAPHQNRLCYSSAPKNKGARTIARTLSKDKSADGNGAGLAVPPDRDHAE